LKENQARTASRSDSEKRFRKAQKRLDKILERIDSFLDHEDEKPVSEKWVTTSTDYSRSAR